MKTPPSQPWLNEAIAANGLSVKENFSAWFGHSKAVDADGKPLVLHHGTASDFSVFDTGRGAIYFAADRGAAQAYADHNEWGDGIPRVVDAYLCIENPKVIDRRWAQENMADADGTIDWTVLDEVAYEAEEMGHDGLILRSLPDFAGVEGGQRIEREYDQYIVFKPTQIKSAVNNSGLYLRENPDMNDRIDACELAHSGEHKKEENALDASVSWFSGSEMVDENQQPLVFYHGTSASFESFEPGENGLVFVSPHSDCAEEFGGMFASAKGHGEGLRVMPLYVNAKRVFDASVHTSEIEPNIDVDQLVRELCEFSKSDWTPQGALSWVRRGEWQALEQPETLKTIRAAGFDAMWVHEMGMKSLAVFDPKQLCSAIVHREDALNWQRAQKAQEAIKTMIQKSSNDERFTAIQALV
jgi:hypothetical protein